jgi:hypothetical protein
MAVILAGILAIENRRDLRGQTRIKNLLGIRDAGRNAGHHLCVGQLLEGFVFGHAPILTDLGAPCTKP